MPDVLDITLFGACAVRSCAPASFAVTGAKQMALFALLATAPEGRRTRAFVQETLWGRSCYDTGRQSLRRALADIKAAMGPSFAQALSAGHAELQLDLSRVRFSGGPGEGLFLEGLDIREAGFQSWRNAIRDNPAQLARLYALPAELGRANVLPVIAVIPFRAVGGDAGDAALGDWLAEEVCRSLSRSRLLAVISHLSSRQLARTIVELAAVRDVLKADFCVWGSLRHCGDAVVVDADFIDVRTGRIVWTRQFSGSVADLLATQSEGVAAIVNAIGAAALDEALAHVRTRELNAVEDHRLLMAGVGMMHRSTLKEFAQSRALIEEAARRAPKMAEIHAWLAKWHVLSVSNRWSTGPERDAALAADASARALDLKPDDTFCLTVDGLVRCNLMRRLDVAEERYGEALKRNPNESLAWVLKGALHSFRSEASLAIQAVEHAALRSPIDPFGYYYDTLAAGAYVASGEFERALALAERSWRANERHVSTLRVKIICLASIDRVAEAKRAATELLRLDPAFTVDAYLKHHPCADFAIAKRVARAFRDAGLP